MSGTGVSSVRSYNFHLDTTIAGAGTYANNGPFSFVDEIDATPFLSQTLQFINSGAADIYFSFDGVNDHGRVAPAEEYSQPFRHQRKIWFRGVAGNAYRFFAW